MKSIQFKKNPGGIRMLKEDEPKKKINWDKIIYISIMVGILVIGGKYFYDKYAYVKAEGNVLFEKVNIQFTSDVRIMNYHHKEQDEVAKGDSLFTYVEENTLVSNLSEAKRLQEWVRHEISDTREKIFQKEIEKSETSKLLHEYKTDKERIKKEVYLDVYSADKLDPYVKKEFELNSQVQILSKELIFLNKYLDSLNTLSENPLALAQTLSSANQGVKVFYAPTAGRINKLIKKEYEVAVSSEPVLSLLLPQKPPYVQAFFQQRDLKHLKEGDLVTVTFPDGTKSAGSISRFYSETHALPKEFQNEFEPGGRRIAVDIVPLNKEELYKWKLFHQMSVIVSKKVF